MTEASRKTFQLSPAAGFGLWALYCSNVLLAQFQHSTRELSHGWRTNASLPLDLDSPLTSTHFAENDAVFLGLQTSMLFAPCSLCKDASPLRNGHVLL